MSRTNGASQPEDELELTDEEALDEEEYDALMELERLESLEEEMMEMGVVTLDDVRQRITDLHRQLDNEAE